MKQHFTNQYELVAKDECGEEIVITVGSKAEINKAAKTAKEDYPECRGFTVNRVRDYDKEARDAYDNDYADGYGESF